MVFKDKIKISDSARESFRKEILQKVGYVKRRNEPFTYKTLGKLREAIEKQLFYERQNILRRTISTRNLDVETSKKIDEIIERLIKEYKEKIL